jgi:hypothetical protein
MPTKPESKFRVPYINAKFLMPITLVLSLILISIKAPSHFSYLFTIHGIPMLFFWIITIIITIYSFIRKFSLIPVLGMLSCFYLMAQETPQVWIRFLIWLVIGLVIYFFYSRKNSKLNIQI